MLIDGLVSSPGVDFTSTGRPSTALKLLQKSDRIFA
jgi:hypothetical protein